MALRDQPYFPLYVQDYLTDEKLNLCSWSTQGIYIKILCILHKQKEYGKLLFKQTDKQKLSTCLNFAAILIRLLPCQIEDMNFALEELVENDVLTIEGNYLYQRRMVKDGAISDARSKAGKKGGGNPILFKQTDKQITEDENEDVILIKNTITKLCNSKAEIVFKKFEEWKRYLYLTHGTEIKENIFAYQTLERNLKTFGVEGYIKAVENSIDKNYKNIYAAKENKDAENYTPPHKKRVL